MAEEHNDRVEEHVQGANETGGPSATPEPVPAEHAEAQAGGPQEGAGPERAQVENSTHDKPEQHDDTRAELGEPARDRQGDPAGAPIAPDDVPNGTPSGLTDHPERAEQADPHQPQHQIPVDGDLQDPDAKPADMSDAPPAAEADAAQQAEAERAARFNADRFAEKTAADLEDDDNGDEIVLDPLPPGAGSPVEGFNPAAPTPPESRRANEVGEQQAQTLDERVAEENKVAFGAGAPPVADPAAAPVMETPETPNDHSDADREDDDAQLETPEHPGEPPAESHNSPETGGEWRDGPAPERKDESA